MPEHGMSRGGAKRHLDPEFRHGANARLPRFRLAGRVMVRARP